MKSGVEASIASSERRKEPVKEIERKVVLIGGGIASLAAAVFLIRDGDIPGHNITILEESGVLGGALDGAGTPETGYVIRGGRMLESKYVCTYDLFSSIPVLDDSGTVTQEIFSWNDTMKTSSKSRLVRGGYRVDAPKYGLCENHVLTLERLAIEPESVLGNSSIADQFDPDFFETDFWLMWCTTFAFQPWHSAVEFKRYIVRFSHMIDGFNRLHGIMRTVYNQYDSMVRPLQKWLEQRDVRFRLNTRVTDLVSEENRDGKRVRRILYQCGESAGELEVAGDDLVIVTLGSMTESSSFGSMQSAPVLQDTANAPAWALWKQIARGRPEFGRPTVFADHIKESKWVSFTTTLRDPAFFRIVGDFTGNVPGEGGLITFAQSSWRLSIVLPHQPHFLSQPQDVSVFWGYGLSVDNRGDYVKRPMSECTGIEIMTELLDHLWVGNESTQILATSNCIPCMMPFITSQFLRRERGDRPQVIPRGWRNLAFTGQFCELRDDVVFTVEYSIRSAQTAVYRLLGLKRRLPPVYKGMHDPRVLFKAYRSLHDMGAS